ncbi:MAG TPA: hypothetical protein VEA38_03165, partial [Terriglobales bacterium]|nr:hypothetical protein [Terriglobales bacterium]
MGAPTSVKELAGLAGGPVVPMPQVAVPVAAPTFAAKRASAKAAMTSEADRARALVEETALRQKRVTAAIVGANSSHLGPIAAARFEKQQVARAASGVSFAKMFFRSSAAREVAMETPTMPSLKAAIAAQANSRVGLPKGGVRTMLMQSVNEALMHAEAAKLAEAKGDKRGATKHMQAAGNAYLRLWHFGREVVSEKALLKRAAKAKGLLAEAAAARAAGNLARAEALEKKAAAAATRAELVSTPPGLYEADMNRTLKVIVPTGIPYHSKQILESGVWALDTAGAPISDWTLDATGAPLGQLALGNVVKRAVAQVEAGV